MSWPPKNYGPLLHRIAVAHECTELGVFDVQDGPEQMWLLYYATGTSGGRTEGARREAAIIEFKKLIAQYPLQAGKDALLEVEPSPDQPMFCLIILARRAGKVVGAAAFIKRFKSWSAARAELKTIQQEAGGFWTGKAKLEYFNLGPPKSVKPDIVFCAVNLLMGIVAAINCACWIWVYYEGREKRIAPFLAGGSAVVAFFSFWLAWRANRWIRRQLKGG